MDINIIVQNGNVLSGDQKTLFGDESVECIEPMSIPDLMLKFGIYKSKSQAIKAGRTGQIPNGWVELKASKKVYMFIWNPTE